MRLFSSRALRPVLALAALALGACADHPDLTEAARAPRPQFDVLSSTSPGITALTLSADSVVIGGALSSYTATLDNPGTALNGVVVQGWITQGTARRAAGGQLLRCDGSPFGVLPNGTCIETGAVVVSNTGGGTGTLVPGAASFVLNLQDSTGVVLDSAVVPVTLLPNSPIITAINLSTDTVFIGGALVPYTANIKNPLPTLSGVLVQGFIAQGTTLQPAGGTVVFCGSGAGVLPTGNCTVSFTLGASASSSLVPGAATFQLQLKDSTGKVVDTRTAPVTLLPNTPFITALNLSSTTVTIDGPTDPFTTSIRNPGPARTSALIQGLIHQGSTIRAANGTLINCGSGLGLLPNGTCTVSFELSASNRAGGSGTLVPGAASFELQLKDSTGILDTETVAVTLVSKDLAKISALSVSSTTPIVIGVTRPSYSATIDNPGVSLSNVKLLASVSQDTARRTAGTLSVSCGSGSGVLPTGTCTVSSTLFASNSGNGSGMLVQGPANLELQLLDSAGKVLSTATLPVTIYDRPTISAVRLSTDTLVVGGSSVPFSVTIENPGTTLTPMVMAYAIKQGTAQRSGGSALSFSLPNGSKTVTGSIAASNSSNGSGTLVAGDATVEVTLNYNFFTFVYRTTVPVVLK